MIKCKHCRMLHGHTSFISVHARQLGEVENTDTTRKELIHIQGTIIIIIAQL